MSRPILNSFRLLFFGSFFLALSLFFPSSTLAANPYTCQFGNVTLVLQANPDSIMAITGGSVTFTVTSISAPLTDPQPYGIRINSFDSDTVNGVDIKAGSKFKIDFRKNTTVGEFPVELRYTPQKSGGDCGTYSIITPPACNLTFDPNSAGVNEMFHVNITNLYQQPNCARFTDSYSLNLNGNSVANFNSDNNFEVHIPLTLSDLGLKTLTVHNNCINTDFCSNNINICATNPCPTPEPIPTGPVTSSKFNLCERITDTTEKSKCVACSGNDGFGGNGIYTAIGCIPTNPQAFVGAILTIALGMGGGVALLLMIYGGFLVSTSAGNPESAQKGKEVFSGAIMGLLFIIFSVVLLKIIGVDILHIPGF